MSQASAAARAFAAVLRRDLQIYVTYRTRLVSQALTALFSLTLFYYVSRLINVNGFASPNAYFAYVVVGIALVSVLYSCFSVAENVRQELIVGTFERLLLSPFGPIRSLLAMTLFPILLAFTMATLTLLLGWAVYGLELHWSTVPLALPVMLVALLAFLPFGILFAALTLVVKQGNVGISWVVALISIVGGLYFPVTLLPQWAQTATELQPFTPATELLRHLLVGSPMQAAPSIALAKVLGFADVLIPLSLLLLRQAIRLGQRRGTIIEY